MNVCVKRWLTERGDAFRDEQKKSKKRKKAAKSKLSFAMDDDDGDEGGSASAGGGISWSSCQDQRERICYSLCHPIPAHLGAYGADILR